MSAVPAMGVVEAQLIALRAVFPEAAAMPRADGTVLITVPSVPLPPTWNQTQTTVHFLAPIGYPMAKPDCFWADPSLRLAANSMPNASNLTPIPGESLPRLWFSWHLSIWNPITDTLLTYVRVIQNRFGRGN